jgi:hypothetical protein
LLLDGKEQKWIPACAGMTTVIDDHALLRGSKGVISSVITAIAGVFVTGAVP